MKLPPLSPERLTLLRIGLSLAGFAAALVAVAFESARLGWAAIALLAGSLVLRLKRQDRAG